MATLEPVLMEVGYELPNDDWLMTPKLDVQSGDKLSFFAGSSHDSNYLEDMDVHMFRQQAVSHQKILMCSW